MLSDELYVRFIGSQGRRDQFFPRFFQAARHPIGFSLTPYGAARILDVGFNDGPSVLLIRLTVET